MLFTVASAGLGIAVAGIARSIELFNQAFRLALPHLNPQDAQSPSLSRALSDAIRRRIKLGETDAVRITADSLAEIGQRHVP